MNLVKKLFSRSAKSTESASPKKSERTGKEAAPLSPMELTAIAKGERAFQGEHTTLSEVVAQLEFGAPLVTFAQNPGRQQKIALARIAHLLDAGAVSYQQLDAAFVELEPRLHLSLLCGNQIHFDHYQNLITSQEQRLSLCMQSHSRDLRQALLAELHNAEHLQTFAKTVKGRDNVSYKLARNKLDAIKKAQEHTQQIEGERDRLLTELKQHLQRAVNHDFALELERLERKSERLSEGASDAWRANVREGLEHGAELIRRENAPEIEDDTRIEAASGAREPATDGHSPADSGMARSLYEGCISASRSLLQIERPSDTELSTLERTFETIHKQWQDLATEQKSLLQSQFTQLLHVSLAWLDNRQNNSELEHQITRLHDENADWQTQNDAVQQLKREIHPLVKALRNAQIAAASLPLAHRLSERETSLKAALKREEQAHKHLLGLIRKARAAVRDGNLKRAHGIRYSAQEQLQKLTVVPAPLDKAWQELLEALSTLEDWHTYAAEPKLKALVEQMQTLAEQPSETAELQETRVKHLQDEWRLISKGSAGKHEALWQTFREAAERAFEPCRQRYAVLDAERQANSDKRDALLAQLSGFLGQIDWERADWALTEKLLQTSKRNWRDYAPSLRDNRQRQQDEFDRVIGEIETRLNAEYDRNRAEKERLVRSVETLVASPELDQAIELAIKFQKQWKTIGRCRRRDDEKLWKQFRSHCDAIFARRDEQRQAQRAHVDQEIAKAEGALTRLEAIVAMDDADFDKHWRDSENINDEFFAVEELPRPVQTALRARQQKLAARIENRQRSAQTQKAQNRWQALFAIKFDLHQNDSLSESEREALAERIGALDFAPGSSRDRLRALPEAELSAEDSGYRMLCIEAEVLAGRDTPADDKRKRMQYQVEQLQAGLGQQAASAEDLAERWLSGNRLQAALYAPLHDRFLASWQVLAR